MPSISTITPATFDSGRAVTLSGSGFGASQGSVLIGGQAQTVTSWSDTSITFTTARGSQSMGACRVDVVAGAGGTLIAAADFESGFVPAGWSTYTGNGGTLTVSADTAENYGNSAGSIKGSNPAVNDVSLTLIKDLSALNLSELYVQFKAKMPSTNKRGLKFCKVFGQISGSNYANCTFNLNYADGVMRSVISGDGSGTTNDASIRYSFNGDNVLGRNSGVATISNPQNAYWSAWGSTWHDFKFHVKFNSGTTAENETPDGEFHVWIDDVPYLSVTGCYNRHYSNGPIGRVEFYGYTTGTAAFDLWYDDIRVSTGGFA